MDDKKLEEIGKEMVRKCGCLPLIISVLGGLLSEKKSSEDWESVNEKMNAGENGNVNKKMNAGENENMNAGENENVNKKMNAGENENEIHAVLRLSYEDLPFYLKPCFLLMGQFMEDENIYVPDLYLMWIAHGIISHEHGREDQTLIDIAADYYLELISRRLVSSDIGAYYQCQLHDAVRELCLSEGKKEGFNFQVINYGAGGFCSLLNESLSRTGPRHLSIHFEGRMTSKPDRLTVHCKDHPGKFVRTLQFLNRTESEMIELQKDALKLEEFKLLRVLVFANFRFKGRHLKGIRNLIHLRQLSLRWCELDELPSSIRNLKFLHTLDLQFCENIKVPDVFKKMPRLKYLFLPLYEKEWVEQNNYHLTLEGLDELELLGNFNSLVHDSKSIATMKNLREINAIIYDNESLSAVIDVVITNLTKLRIFALEINTGCRLGSIEKDLAILKNVFSCQTLFELLIRVPIKKLLLEKCVAEISTSRLVHLILQDCEIAYDPMQILGKFPFLEDLCLYRRAFVGEEMKCHASSFPRLKTIVLERLPNLREWTVEQGAMPLLSSIIIKNCRLEKIPGGLRFAQNLQELKIIGMPELGKRVDAEVGEDFDKVRHVPSIIIG